MTLASHTAAVPLHEESPGAPLQDSATSSAQKLTLALVSKYSSVWLCLKSHRLLTALGGHVEGSEGCPFNYPACI